jgi:hypothetical protein
VEPGESATTDVTINPTEWDLSPARGIMALITDNASGEAEAELIQMSKP